MDAHVDFMLLVLSLVITGALARNQAITTILMLPYLLYLSLSFISEFIIPAFENYSENMYIPLFYGVLIALTVGIVLLVVKYNLLQQPLIKQSPLASKISLLLLVALIITAYFAPQEVYRFRTMLAGICLGMYIRVVRQEFLSK